jgi:hypothetical protein
VRAGVGGNFSLSFSFGFDFDFGLVFGDAIYEVNAELDAGRDDFDAFGLTIYGSERCLLSCIAAWKTGFPKPLPMSRKRERSQRS